MATRTESLRVGAASAAGWPWIPPLVGVTAAAVITEALMLRTATRVFIHIPGVDVSGGALGGLAVMARTAFRMAVLLSLVLMVVMMLRLAASSQRITALLVGGVLTAMAGSWATGNAAVFEVATLSLVAALGGMTVARRDGPSRIPVGAWTAAFVLMGLVQSSDQLTAAGGPAISLATFGVFAEGVAVAAFVAAPLVLRFRPHWSDWAAGASVSALMVVILHGAQGSATAKILLLWNFGFTGVMPGLFYAFALGGVTVAIVASVRTKRNFDAAALVFMTAAGFGLFSSYQTMLMALGLILLGQKVTPDGSGEEPSILEESYSS